MGIKPGTIEQDNVYPEEWIGGIGPWIGGSDEIGRPVDGDISGDPGSAG